MRILVFVTVAILFGYLAAITIHAFTGSTTCALIFGAIVCYYFLAEAEKVP